MDRKAWIAVTLSVVGLIAYYWYTFNESLKHPRPRPVAAQTTPGTPTPTPANAVTTPGTDVATPVEAGAPAPVVAKSETLATNSADYIFSNDAGGIESVALTSHLTENGGKVLLNKSRALPIGAIGKTPGEVWGGFELQADSMKGEATFVRKGQDGLETVKRFVLPARDGKEDAYRVQLDIEFRNTGKEEVAVPDYFVSTGGAAPIHTNDMPMYTRFDLYHNGKMEGIDVNWFPAANIPLIGIQWSPEKSIYEKATPAIAWAAVASQYFTTIVTPKNDKGISVWAKRFPTDSDRRHFGIQGGLGMPGFKVPAGQTVKQSFLIYSGPKELHRLRELKPVAGGNGGQDAVLNFGMFWWVSEILLWGMNSLHGLLHSYAAAIIVLTIIIKSLLWPLQNKATNEMRRMSLLSPKMTELREKYKDDPQKMNEETMKLYREYGVNPLAGCLPMLIQIPIFFGFYSMLGCAIELRNSTFLWIRDLSQPDTIGHIPFLNFPINLIPIVMAGTMVWQMAISPKSGDKMQQRMMLFMPIIFLVFSYNYASALALYWTTQNIFSIVQLYLTRNKPLPTLEKKSVAAKREAAAAQKKKKKRE